jgi:hypothetical protein
MGKIVDRRTAGKEFEFFSLTSLKAVFISAEGIL